MISTGDVKKGVIIELDGQLMKVLDWTHIKMARGSAQVRMKLQNVRRGDIVERTFQAGTRWPRARVEQRKVQYLYCDGDAYHFMDNETYDQFAISAAQLGDDARFLKENTDVFVSSYEGEVLGRRPAGHRRPARDPDRSRLRRRHRHRRQEGRPPSRPGSWSRCRSSSTRATCCASTPAPAST